ncbi:MAG: hypothetical protein IPH13_20910 [Planctomycetes bacterium]|nr:hypothetical protein [Planctomycetota bacterium]
MGIPNGLRRAYRFFHEHAGYCVGRRAKGALDLARAERNAANMGYTFSEEADFDADLSFMDAKEREQEHECIGMVCRDADGNVLASLWGIVDADANYRRVVRAELALEALVPSA